MALPSDKWVCLDRRLRPRTTFYQTQQQAVDAGTSVLLGSDEPALGVVLVKNGPAPGDDELAQPSKTVRYLKFGEVRFTGSSVEYVSLPIPDNLSRRDADLVPPFIFDVFFPGIFPA